MHSATQSSKKKQQLRICTEVLVTSYAKYRQNSIIYSPMPLQHLMLQFALHTSFLFGLVLVLAQVSYKRKIRLHSTLKVKVVYFLTCFLQLKINTISKSASVCPNWPHQPTICPQYALICPNLPIFFKFGPICPNLSQFVTICLNLPQFAPIFPQSAPI